MFTTETMADELAQLKRQYAAHPLGELGYWKKWQETVIKAMPNFAANYLYLAQGYERGEYERVAEVLWNRGHRASPACTKDAEYGAMVVETKALGPVTRSFLDSEIELDFLGRHVDIKAPMYVLDVGAGYGRFAAALATVNPNSTISCVDAVPISTYLQRQYTKDFKHIHVHGLDFMDNRVDMTLVVNIHSWSECNIEQVKRWLDRMDCDYLFTAANTPGYETFGGGTWKGESFKPLLESRFKLLGEESDLGVDRNSTYAVWRVK